MNTVSASQLLYSRVEPVYSHQRKGGFQTVYQTPSLPATDVAVIEARIQRFIPGPAAEVRLQFFPLESGAFVIAHSCGIESDRAITDAEGRTGAFLAHCLILATDEFSKLQENPFALINTFPFIQNPAAMVKTFGQATGIAPSVSIQVETAFPAVGAHWENRELDRLIALTEAAPHTLREPQSVQILGEVDEILAMLSLAFWLMRRQTRCLCSFDTATDQATVKPGDYWAVGRTQRHSRFAYTVQATQRRVDGQSTPPLPTPDLYLVLQPS